MIKVTTPSGAQRPSLKWQSEILHLAVLPSGSVVTGLGHMGEKMECFSLFSPIIMFLFQELFVLWLLLSRPETGDCKMVKTF